MATLTACIKKGKNLNDTDVQEIRDMAQSMVGEGLSPQEAGMQAIAAQIDSLVDDRGALLSDVGASMPDLALPNYSAFMNPVETVDPTQSDTKTAINGDLERTDPVIRDAVMSAIGRESKTEAKRIMDNLEKFKGSPWAVTAIKGLAVREFFHLAAAKQGTSSRAQSILDSDVWGKSAGAGMRSNHFIKAAIDGNWQNKIVTYDAWIIDNVKAEKSISTSMKNCDPSKACATHCYDATGTGGNPASIIKSEATEWAVEMYPELIADRLERDYKGSALGVHGLALRLNDKGDLSPSQVNLTNAMAKRGIRMQIFSKRPDLLDQVDSFHLRMLSVDGTNMETAQGNDHMLAITLTNDLRDDDLVKIADRAAVVLPVNLAGMTWSTQELKNGWPKSFAKFKTAICPVEADLTTVGKGSTFVTIVDPSVKSAKKDGKKVWTCTSCDKLGTHGCFHGKRQTSVAKADMLASSDPDTNDNLAVINEIGKQLSLLVASGGMTSEQRDNILEEIRKGGGALSGIADAFGANTVSEEYSRGSGEAGGSRSEVSASQIGFQFGFTLKDDPYEDIETRPGTTEEQKEIGRGFMGDLQRWVESRYIARGGQRNRGITPIASAFVKDFQEGKPGQLIGKTVLTKHDLAFAAQVYRDPRIETLRTFFVKDGVIVEERAVSSRLAGAVEFYDADVFRDVDPDSYDGFYMMHNHPSGDSSPSRADITTTKNFGKRYPGKFLGQVVIDHNEYSTIAVSGRVSKESAPQLAGLDFRANPELPSDYLFKELNGLKEVAEIGKQMQTDSHQAVLITTGPKSEITSIHGFPMDMISSFSNSRAGKSGGLKRSGKTELAAIYRKLMRETGSAGESFLVLPDGFDPSKFAWMHRRGGVRVVFSGDQISYLKNHDKIPGGRSSLTTRIIREETIGIEIEEAKRNSLNLFSGLEQAVIDMKLPGFVPSKRNPDGAARGADIAAKIRNSGLKKEELQWTGITELLTIEPEARYTRQQVIDMVRENMVEVDESVAGGPEAAQDETESDDYQMAQVEMTDEEKLSEAIARIEDDLVRGEQSSIGDTVVQSWIEDDQQSAIKAAEEETEFDSSDFVDDEDDSELRMALFEAIADSPTIVMDIPRRYFKKALKGMDVYVQSIVKYQSGAEPDTYYAGTESDGYVVYRNGSYLGEAYSQNEANVMIQGGDGGGESWSASGTQWARFTLDGPKESYQEIKITLPKNPGDQFLKTEHKFPEPNIVGFLRTTRRNGGDMLFIEEAQSDWHQDGREDGYVNPDEYAEVERREEEYTKKFKENNAAVKAARTKIFNWYKDQYKNGAIPANLGFRIKQGVDDLDSRIEREAEYSTDFNLDDLIASVRTLALGEVTYLDEGTNEIETAVFPDSLPAELVSSLSEKINKFVQDSIESAGISDDMIRMGRMVSDAPFKDEAWLTLLAKRALVEAARNGETQLGWMSADQMVKRWGEKYRTLYTNVYDRKFKKAIEKLAGQKAQRTHVGESLPTSPELYLYNRKTGEKTHWSEVIELEDLVTENPNDNKAMQAIAKIWQRGTGGTDPGDVSWMTFAEIAEINTPKAWSIDLPQELRDEINGKGFTMFRETGESPQGYGMSVDDVRGAVSSLPDNLMQGAVVVQSIADLPAQLADIVRRQSNTGSVAGLHERRTGTVFLVADGIKNKRDAQATLLHEAVGHRGIERVMGRDFDLFLGMVRDARNSDPVIEEAFSYVDRVYAGSSDYVKAAEVVAKIAESDPKHTLVQRAIQWMRRALRQLGFTVTFTNDDIIEALRRAKGTQRGDGPNPDGVLYKKGEAPSNLEKWLGKSVVRNDKGEPLTVYRGEHGESKAQLNSELASYSFGSKEIANVYSSEPNNASRHGKNPSSPRVIPAYLKIENPIFNDPSDPFIDLSIVSEKLGPGLAREMAIKEADYIYDTSFWVEDIDGQFNTVEEYLDSSPDAINNLYVHAFRLLDDQKFVSAAKAAGYDGAIHAEYGFHSDDGDGAEYKVFDPSQVKSAIGNNGDFDPSSSNILLREADLPASETTELNRNMREQNKTIAQQAKRAAKRYLAPGGLLPKDVFDEKISRDSELEAGEMDVKRMVLGIERAYKQSTGKEYTKISKEEEAMIDAAIRGNPSPDLDPAIAVAAEEMRQHIDSLSDDYIAILGNQAQRLLDDPEADPAQAQAKVDLMMVIAGNKGEYLNRSYRAYDDADWPKKVPDTVLNAARSYLVDRATDGGSDATEAAKRAEQILADILKVGTAFDSMEAYIQESKLGAKDLSLLKKRKEIAPEIRELLGEYRDPRLNFAKTVTKMNRLIFNDTFLERLREIGMGDFFFEDGDHPPEAYVTIAAEGSESYSPLNGLRTYPDMDLALKDAMARENLPNWYRTIVQLNGMVKFGKTVLSPTTAARNFMSAYFFTMANGHFDMTKLGKAMVVSKTYWADHGGSEAYMRKLKQLGVVYDTPYAGEMMRLLEDTKMTERLLRGTTGAEKALDVAQKFYRWGDDFWKIVGFENEVALMKKHYGLDQEAAMKKAAERIRNTYPTYSMIGKAVNSLRRFPLAGTFVSFPAEIIRTSIHIVKYASEDFKQSPTLGMRRVAGMGMVGSFAYVAQEMAKNALGVDDEEDEAIRQNLAEWNENSNLMYLSRDNGNLRFIDLSFLDPYNYFKRPLTAMMRDEPWEDIAADIIRETVTPFLGQDITAGSISEIMLNKKGSGGKVFNESDMPAEQMSDIAMHLWKTVRPGIMANADRLYKAYSGEQSRSGRQYDMNDELMALAGFRVSTLDPKVSLMYRTYEIRDTLSDSRSKLTRLATEPNPVTDEKLESTLDRMIEVRMDAYKDLLELIDSSKISGLDNAAVIRQLRAAGVSKKDSFVLAQGKVPTDVPTNRWMAKQISSSEDRFGAKWRTEFTRRRNLLRKLYAEKWAAEKAKLSN